MICRLKNVKSDNARNMKQMHPCSADLAIVDPGLNAKPPRTQRLMTNEISGTFSSSLFNQTPKRSEAGSCSSGNRSAAFSGDATTLVCAARSGLMPRPISPKDQTSETSAKTAMVSYTAADTSMKLACLCVTLVRFDQPLYDRRFVEVGLGSKSIRVGFVAKEAASSA